MRLQTGGKRLSVQLNGHRTCMQPICVRQPSCGSMPNQLLKLGNLHSRYRSFHSPTTCVLDLIFIHPSAPLWHCFSVLNLNSSTPFLAPPRSALIKFTLPNMPCTKSTKGRDDDSMDRLGYARNRRLSQKQPRGGCAAPVQQ